MSMNTLESINIIIIYFDCIIKKGKWCEYSRETQFESKNALGETSSGVIHNCAQGQVKGGKMWLLSRDITHYIVMRSSLYK